MSSAATEFEDLIASCHLDPERWVDIAYPWGEGVLDGERVREWQRECLRYIGDQLKQPLVEDESQVIRYAVGSGHGIGKSTLSAQLIDWGMSTMSDCRVICFANTEEQLKTKLGGELRKWRDLNELTPDWFNLKALSMYHPEYQQTWRCDLQAWSELRPEAIQGTHNKGRRILIIMDEASAIPRVIWEALEGALTDTKTQIIWVAFGNLTRTSGSFAECFKLRQERWHGIHIDASKIPGTNKQLFKQWAEDFGEDSDFYKVRVLGQFPSLGDLQFISDDLVSASRKTRAESTVEDPKIIGIDVARSGANRSVMWTRVGRDAQSLKPIILPSTEDSMHFAARVVDYLGREKPDAVFIDGGGIGGPVADRIKQLGWPVIEVQFGSKADNPTRFANKRAEMWWRMREWMRNGGAMWDNYQVEKEFAVTESSTDPKDRILLESKESLRKRGESSPDLADALALTFAYPVVTAAQTSIVKNGRAKSHARVEYNRFR